MTKKRAKDFLGSQIWIEPTDSTERIDELVAEAAKAGLGWLRNFLIWPWIEAKPGEWDFRAYDDLFDACQRHGIKIKATLTANSGPWHIGTPSLLHSHTGFLGKEQYLAIEEYVRQCVSRYARHPALGQWILWNEPTGGDDHTVETLDLWREWLGQKYESKIGEINVRWRTGYKSFDEIPFAEDVPHHVHKQMSWRSYKPLMDDCEFRSYWLLKELDYLAGLVRKIDSKTPLCINPIQCIGSYAKHGLNLDAMGDIVDVIGASYHPAWHLTYAKREQFSAIMAAGVRKQAAHSHVERVEVTEVQSGNTLNSSNKPSAVEESELARFYLAGIFSGAESVTGWLLNMRSYDFEAGDWGLLDDQDKASSRTIIMKKVHDCIDRLLKKEDGWSPSSPKIHVGFSVKSQVVEFVDNQCVGVPGRLPDDSAFGTSLIAAFLMQRGISCDIRTLEDMPEDGKNGGVIFLSHVLAWESDVEKALKYAKTGGTLVLDAACGRKNYNAEMHRPWPGAFAAVGLESVGMESNPDGYEISLYGNKIGKWILTRMVPKLIPGSHWKAQEALRFTSDGSPCIYERSYGKGKIILVNGILGPSLVHDKSSDLSVRYIIDSLCSESFSPVRPVVDESFAFALQNDGISGGKLTVILAENILSRNGRMLGIIAPAGKYTELWTGEEIQVSESGEISMKAEDGIVVLYQSK